MRSGIDCKGKEWEEIEVSKFMTDISQYRFGFLTALFPVKTENVSPYANWLCMCDCGNIVVRQTYSLKNGSTHSCGCERYKQVKETKFKKHQENIGKKFGKLVVLDIVDAPFGIKDRRAYYKCICDCGETAIVRSTDITNGKTTSCGCSKKDAQQDAAKNALEKCAA